MYVYSWVAAQLSFSYSLSLSASVFLLLFPSVSFLLYLYISLCVGVPWAAILVQKFNELQAFLYFNSSIQLLIESCYCCYCQMFVIFQIFLYILWMYRKAICIFIEWRLAPLYVLFNCDPANFNAAAGTYTCQIKVIFSNCVTLFEVLENQNLFASKQCKFTFRKHAF